MIDLSIGIVSGLIAGLITPAIIYFISRCVILPKIKISNYISHVRIGQEERYYIKVVNRSRFYCVDVAYYLFLYNLLDDESFDVKDIPSRVDKVQMLYPKSKSNRLNENALQISFNISDDDIQKLKEGQNGEKINHLFLYLECKHAKSNGRKIITKKYDYDAIKENDFELGDSLEISDSKRD